jgi:hypothetical protein
MSDQPSITDTLKSLESATVYEKFDDIIKRYSQLIGKFAGFLLTLNPEGVLPHLNTQNWNTFAQLRTDGNISLQDRTGHAYFCTRQLAQFSGQLAGPPTDQQRRNAIQDSFSISASEFLAAWGILVPVLQADSGAGAIARTREALDEVQNIRKSMATLLSDSQEAAKSIGAGRHAEAFKMLSDQYKKNAAFWLRWTVVIVVVFSILVIASGIWTFSIPKDDPGRLVQVVVGKVVLLGVLYYLLVLFARSYRANAHLAAVNLHRATALQIFATFADATADEQTKNAILLETTRSIYSHTSTGFLVGEDPSSPVQIVEILKALGPKQSQ